MDTLRVCFAAAFILSGLFVLGVATLGLFRMKYVLNRMHAAAKCDTLGATLVLIGALLLLPATISLFKLLALVVFIWLSSPVAVFLIGQVEIQTNPHLEDECEVKRL